MRWFFNKAKKGLQDLKAATQSAYLLPRSTPLAPQAYGDQMVYVCNAAKLEIGQGANSHMRVWVVLIYFGALAGIITLYAVAPVFLDGPFEETYDLWIFLVLITPVMLIGFVGISSFLYLSFFAITDPTVRLSHKRRKVWIWTAKGPIEIDWARLVPRVTFSTASAYATVKIYRGQYVEVGPDGNIITTNGIPHAFQVGQISAAEEGVRVYMEFVRRYMEQGPQSVQPPARLLSHSPRWYAMVNLFGMADEWAMWYHNRDKPEDYPPPWGRTIFFIVFFPIFFPLQFTNWLALMVAPKPKWPKELDALLDNDLALPPSTTVSATLAGLEASGQPSAEMPEISRPRRTPVIRVNGEIINPE